VLRAFERGRKESKGQAKGGRIASHSGQEKRDYLKTLAEKEGRGET